MPDDSWRRIGETHFPDVPLDCGNKLAPRLIDGADARDWSKRPSTADQLRIERYIDRYDLRTKRILHLGIGNSGLAQRMAARCKEIVGVSVDAAEIDVARSLSLANYVAIQNNKYVLSADAVDRRFDFIVDNNPTSTCCCIFHLANFFTFISANLADDGQLVTDSEGLAWVPDQANRGWSADFGALSAIATLAGLSSYRIDRHIYVLARGTPAKPRLVHRLEAHVRRMQRLPEKMRSAVRRAVG
jgi:hypothetical protein